MKTKLLWALLALLSPLIVVLALITAPLSLAWAVYVSTLNRLFPAWRAKRRSLLMARIRMCHRGEKVPWYALGARLDYWVAILMTKAAHKIIRVPIDDYLEIILKAVEKAMAQTSIKEALMGPFRDAAVEGFQAGLKAREGEVAMEPMVGDDPRWQASWDGALGRTREANKIAPPPWEDESE